MLDETDGFTVKFDSNMQYECKLLSHPFNSLNEKQAKLCHQRDFYLQIGNFSLPIRENSDRPLSIKNEVPSST